MYAYGVILFEIISLLHPREILDFETHDLGAKNETKYPRVFTGLMVDCLSLKPNKRPTFDNIYSSLVKMGRKEILKGIDNSLINTIGYAGSGRLSSPTSNSLSTPSASESKASTSLQNQKHVFESYKKKYPFKARSSKSESDEMKSFSLSWRTGNFIGGGSRNSKKLWRIAFIALLVTALAISFGVYFGLKMSRDSASVASFASSSSNSSSSTETSSANSVVNNSITSTVVPTVSSSIYFQLNSTFSLVVLATQTSSGLVSSFVPTTTSATACTPQLLTAKLSAVQQNCLNICNALPTSATQWDTLGTSLITCSSCCSTQLTGSGLGNSVSGSGYMCYCTGAYVSSLAYCPGDYCKQICQNAHGNSNYTSCYTSCASMGGC